jgi:hypothetical protein
LPPGGDHRDIESQRWLKGKEVKLKGFVFNPCIAEHSKENELFNKYGTHAYYEAANMSAVLGPLCQPKEVKEEADSFYKEKSLFCIALMLGSIQDMLGYLITISPKSAEKTPETLQAYKALTRNIDIINKRLSSIT